MEKQLVESYYFDLKTIITSAVLGVFSFQILVPLGLDYLHASFGMKWKDAYDLFVVLYFLIIPIGFLLWLAYHYDIIKIFLPPFNGTSAITKKAWYYLFILIIVIIAGIVLHIFISFWPKSISSWLWWLFIPFSVLSIGLLGLSFYFGKQLVRFKGLASYTDWTRGYFKSLLISLFTYILLVFCGYFFVKHGGETPLTTSPVTTNYKNDLEYAATLLDKIKEVNNLRKDVNAFHQYLSISASIEKKHAGSDTLNNPYFDLLIGNTIGLTHTVNSMNLLISIREDTLKALGKWFFYKPDTIKTHKAIDSLGLKQSFHNLNQSNKGLQSTSKALFSAFLPKSSDGATPMGHAISKEAGFDTTAIHNTKVVSELLLNNSIQMKQMTQRLMGPQLRNLQEWGVVLYLFLLLTLLSLHQFMKLNFEITSWQLKNLEEAYDLNPDLNKAPLIDKAKELERIGEPSKKLWLIITLAIWLFIPLIKPIEDEKINIGAPFRQFTFFDKGISAVPGFQKPKADNETQETSPTFLIRIDSVFIKDTSKSGMPEAIINQLDRIETKSDAALKKMDEIQ
jgi:hypothetical protein